MLTTVTDLGRAGVTRAEMRRRIRSGEWRRVRPGVIATAPLAAGADERFLEQCRALLLQLPPGAAVCGVTAARVHRLPVLKDDGWLHVRPPCGVRMNAPAGCRIHVGRPVELDIVNGVLTTALNQTVLDVAASAPVPTAVVMVDAAAREDPGLLTAVRATLEATRPRGRRRAAYVLATATGLAESPLESWSWLLWRTSRLPLPMQQAVIRRNGRFLARVDFLWPEAMLVVEVDGLEKYDEPFALQREKQRQNQLVAEGYTVLRFTWRDITGQPELVTRQVAAALGLRFSMEMTTKTAI